MALPLELPTLDALAPPPLTVLERPAMRVSESRPLAILGADPAFREPLHVGRPNIGNRAKLQERIDGMLDARWFSNGGPLVCEFEERIARHIGVKHCIATCNGTTALMLAIRGLDLSGEVIVPSFTFVATAHGLLWQQTKPVFCDIDPATHNLDPAAVERLITPWTTGIIGVHLWGRPCDVEALESLAKQHRLKLLFDASHAFACTHRREFVGRFGDAEVFSFHATKFLNAFEGGAIVTDNDALAEKLRLMRNFGFTGTDCVEHIGMNAKMTEICAAMGLTGLESINRFIAVNRRNHAAYRTLLAGLPGLKVTAYDEAERSNFQYVILEVDPAKCALTRDELLRVLQAEHVLARRYFHPGCHRMEPYRTLYPASGLALPETERLSERILALPTGTAVTQEDVETVAAIVCSALANEAVVREAITRA
jgi:dTDP-4-amino-4,6-dideoxygalactose transaminase